MKKRKSDFQHGYSNNCRRRELAQAYVPFQMLHDIFYPEEALMKGTLFPELYFPYRERRCCDRRRRY